MEIVDAVKINSYTYKTKRVRCPFCNAGETVRLNKENEGVATCWICKQMIIYREITTEERWK